MAQSAAHIAATRRRFLIVPAVAVKAAAKSLLPNRPARGTSGNVESIRQGERNRSGDQLFARRIHAISGDELLKKATMASTDRRQLLLSISDN